MQRSQSTGLSGRGSALIFATLFLAAISVLSATAPAAAANLWCVAPSGTTTGCTPTNGQFYTEPSQVAGQVSDGDTVVIEPGTYQDCSKWTNNSLEITADPYVSGTVYIEPNSNTTGTGNCDGAPINGKGIFVIAGNGDTINGIEFECANTGPETFAGCPNPGTSQQSGDYNAAGIILNADMSVTVSSDVFFEDNNGILADNDSDSPTNELTVSGSKFLEDGTCLGESAPSGGCAHGIYAGNIGSLLVEDNSQFGGTNAYYQDTSITTDTGNAIQSRALSTWVVNSTIADHWFYGNGYASYLINAPNGGDIWITGNTMEKQYSSQQTSISIASCLGGKHPTCGSACGDSCSQTLLPTSGLLVGDNTFTDDDPNLNEVIFVYNYYPSGTPNGSVSVCDDTLEDGTGITATIVPLDPADSGTVSSSC
jgi:hypothetical protein